MTLDDEEMRGLTERLLSFPSVSGEERVLQEWLLKELDRLGFETYAWDPDPAVLGANPSFPPLETMTFDGRPSVAGVLELGDPEEGPTVVLNGHADVVPADEDAWTGDPFSPRWDGDRLYARGAADMKAGVVACLGAALSVADRGGLDGRIVVESVAGEEDGGIGAASAAGANPYPFERDAAIVAEPTECELVIATEGSLMKRLTLYGRSAHAGRRWEGESVLPHFERIRRSFRALEAERTERVTHPLYADYETPWPVNVGTLTAGTWASSVPAELTAELRIGVAPHESVESVEHEFDDRLATLVAEDDWLSAHPPDFERFSVQFEGATIDREEPIVRSLHGAIEASGTIEPRYEAMSCGTDSRHYLDAGIPTVVWGPGSIDRAHKANEYVEWPQVRAAESILAEALATHLETAGGSV